MIMLLKLNIKLLTFFSMNGKFLISIRITPGLLKENLLDIFKYIFFLIGVFIGFLIYYFYEKCFGRVITTSLGRNL